MIRGYFVCLSKRKTPEAFHFQGLISEAEDPTEINAPKGGARDLENSDSVISRNQLCRTNKYGGLLTVSSDARWRSFPFCNFSVADRGQLA